MVYGVNCGLQKGVAQFGAGYMAEKEATAAMLDPEGWLRTSDICYFDHEGFLFYVERMKDFN